MPLEKNKGFYVVPKTPAPCEMGPDGLAIPPQEYWEALKRAERTGFWL